MLNELWFINDWRVDYVHSYLKKSFDYGTLMPHRLLSAGSGKLCT